MVMAAIIATTSCTKDADRRQDSDLLEISVSASTVQMTRSSDTFFEDGDEFGLTVVKWLDGKAADMSLIRQEDNIRFTFSNGTPTAYPPVYYPDRSSTCSFFAYYPYNSEGFRPESNILPLRTDTDQSYSYSRSDIMVAVNNNVTPSTQSVPLIFNHILSKIVINLIAGDGCTVSDLKTADVLLKSFNTQAEYDVLTKTVSGYSSRADITPHTGWTESEDRLSGASAIVIPQEFKSGESMLYCVINNKTLAYKPSEPMLFESGKEYTFDITVSVTDLGPAISVSSEITDWTEGGHITGYADEQTPVVGTVEDIDGNMYNYVEINGLYWTASNMRTERYNDGREIPHHDGGSDEWNSLTTPAWCCFENKSENKETLGLLYNYYAVLDGDICPEGWRIPTKDELSALIDETNWSVDVATLISQSWEGMDGTNETGFSAMPSGMAMNHWMMTDCYLWSSTIDENASDDMRYGYLYLSLYPWTDKHFAYVGMGIRCVKEVE